MFAKQLAKIIIKYIKNFLIETFKNRNIIKPKTKINIKFYKDTKIQK